MRVLTTQQADEWTGVLRRCARHDFYSLPGYHAIAERRGEGRALLFVHEEDDHTVALPLLLRSLGDLPELGPETAAEGWHDATSVYGYAGPLSSHEQPPETVARGFQAALREALLEHRVVAVFSRLHPLLLAAQRGLLAGLGECRAGGQTVSMDLTLTPEAQFAHYRSGVRTRLHRQRRENVLRCERDPEKRHLAEFVGIYHETMRRVQATEGYFFEPDYFDQLARALGDGLQLFVVTLGEEIVSASLFTLCDGIVQYHLGATRDAFLKLSPMTLLLDTARLWANERGARVFHLGGGLGSRQDSLFFFKANFSDRRHDFATWRWVTAPEGYGRLSDQRRRADERRGLAPVSPDFFPAYRCPAVPRAEVIGDMTTTPADAVTLATTNVS